MKLMRFLFRYSPRFITVAAVIGILGGLASTAVLAIINAHLRVPSTRGDIVKFFALILVILLTNMAARVFIAALSQWSSFDLRLQLGRKWINTPLTELERTGGNKLMTAITNDVERLSESMHILPGMCIDGTVIVACLGYLAYLSWWMLLVMVGFIVFALITRRVPERKCKELIDQGRVHAEEMIATFNAMRGGIKELKMNRKRWDAFYVGELYNVSCKYRDKNYRAELIFGLIRGYAEILYFLFVGLLFYGAAVTGDLDQKVIVAFAVTLLYMKTNIDHIQENVTQIARAQTALSNLESLGVFNHEGSLSVADLRVRSSRENVARAMKASAAFEWELPTKLKDAIRFEGVEYRYESRDGEREFAIGPIDLTIEAGQLLFVIGGNGSGKTTFAKVLCGLYPLTHGRIVVDGMVVDDGNREWYSQYFGTVFSDSYLFDRLYGTEGIAQEDAIVTEYLRELGLQGKVQILGGRFSTTSLSQGQRKRLALVTAYVENRPVYLFDEWAADQDPEFREFFYHRILRGLKESGKTVVVISHDDRYYHVADRVIKFDSGSLTDQTSRHASAAAMA